MSYPSTLTTNFTWAEAEITSFRDIDNTIPPDIYPAIINTATKMERIREILKHSILINSWYRCFLLNTAVGSNNKTSVHPKGEAVDFICPGYGAPVDVVKRLVANSSILKYDQIILEHTWVHISFPSVPSVKPRGQVLTLLSNKKYAVGITDKNGVMV